ncbi:hypothetical protein GIB67_038361, partial [Kingdonia uniflora]
MWKMSDVESLWDVHFYIEQRDEVPLGIVDPIDLDAISEVLLINSDDDAPIEEIATEVEPIVEPIVSNIQAQRPKKLVTKPKLKKKKTLLKLVDEEDVEQVQVEVQVPERVQDQEQVYKGKRKNEKNTDVGGNTVGEGVEDMGGNTVDGEHRGRVGDMGINTNNWSELDPGNLNAKEGYYSTHTSQDGDDGPTQENIDIYDFEFRDLAKEYDNIFAEEEDAVHSVPPQPTYGELRVGMEWATVYECRAYIRQWSIMNKFEYYQEKNENYRVRLFCIDENCEWMFYARRTTDGHTFTLRKSSNLKHTYSSGAKNRLANVSWVAKQVESVMRRQNAKNWEEKGLVLVPRAQTHIDKLKRQYGQYRIEGTKKGDGNTGQGITGQYVAIAYLIDIHGPMSSYVKTYKDVIYHVVDPPEWGQPQPSYFLPPPLVRGPGRPRKERIHDPDEIRPHKRCGTCGYFGHNKTTCKGPPEVPTEVREMQVELEVEGGLEKIQWEEGLVQGEVEGGLEEIQWEEGLMQGEVELEVELGVEQSKLFKLQGSQKVLLKYLLLKLQGIHK